MDITPVSICSTGEGIIYYMQSYQTFSISIIIISIVLLFSFFTFRTGQKVHEWVLHLLTVSFQVTGTVNARRSLYQHTAAWLFENVAVWPHQIVAARHERNGVGLMTKLQNTPSYDASPHYFKFEGVWIQVTRMRLGVISRQASYEALTFRTFRWHNHILTKLVAEIHAKYQTIEPIDGRTRFYYAHDGSYWMEFGDGKRKRPLNSVILNEHTHTSLVDDLREFLNSEAWYSDRGIPYRRGYLLYGPPGNGKSSFVKAIAGEFGYNICILSLSASRNLNDDTLNLLMNTTPEKSIILLEDIDAAFPSRDVAGDDDEGQKSKRNLISPGETSSGKVTLRGLLNALDGVASTECRIVFLTTNYVERLDPAMTRPGRVDMKIYITLPNDQQLDRMFTRFYPEPPKEHREEFVNVIRALPKPVSLAMVQGLCMLHKHSYSDTLAEALLTSMSSFSHSAR